MNLQSGADYFIRSIIAGRVLINLKCLSLPLVLQCVIMIVSFHSKDTAKIWQGKRVKSIPVEIQQIGRRKLRMINSSQNLNDLRIPPANRLEKLKGKMNNLFSIRINDQWRIIFRWENNNAYDVEIIDYHK